MGFSPDLDNLVSVVNSSETPLAADGVFTGTGEEVILYGSFTIFCWSDKKSATNGLQVEFSTDNTNWINIFTTTVEASISFSENIPIRSRYFRVKYTNGSVAQGEFHLQVILKVNSAVYQSSTLVDGVQRDIQYCYSMGKTDRGDIVPASRVLAGGHGTVAIMHPRTAFGELSTSTLHTEIEGTFVHQVHPWLFDTSVTGSGTVGTTNSSLMVSSGTTSSSSAILMSKATAYYCPGKGLLYRCAALFGTPLSTGTQMLGMGTTSDGYFFGYSGTTFGVARRRSGTQYFVGQSSWNVDKMDGSGPSGMVLNQSKGNVYQIQMQYLGFGDILFSVESVNTGIFVAVHRLSYANAYEETSISNPHMRLHYECTNGATSQDVYLRSGSSMIAVEGNLSHHLGIVVSTGVEKTIIPNVETMMIALRLRSTYHNVVNQSSIIFKMINMSTDGSKAVTFKVYLDCTVTGGTWAYVNSDNSIVECINTEESFSGGRVIWQYYMGAKSTTMLSVLEQLQRLYPNQIIVITAQTTHDHNRNSLSLTWTELQ